MQEAAFRAVGRKAFYLPFEVRQGEFFRLLRNRRKLLLDGFNVTVPYKENVLRLLDRMSPRARAIGAVNTVVRKGKQWIGYNTDETGFIASLEKEGKFQARGKRALILGAGGSARAVAHGLARRGVRQITIANRTVSRARKVINRFRRLFPNVEFVGARLPAGEAGLPRPGRGNNPAPTDKFYGGIDLVVNATSIGLRRGEPALVNPSNFPKKTLFFDLIYNPSETAFLRSAKKSGHRTLNGLGMLLYQGAEAFRFWTGRRAPIGVMRRALEDGLHRGH